MIAIITHNHFLPLILMLWAPYGHKVFKVARFQDWNHGGTIHPNEKKKKTTGILPLQPELNKVKLISKQVRSSSEGANLAKLSHKSFRLYLDCVFRHSI